MTKTYKRYLAPVISGLVLVLLLTFSFTAVKSNTAKAELQQPLLTADLTSSITINDMVMTLSSSSTYSNPKLFDWQLHYAKGHYVDLSGAFGENLKVINKLCPSAGTIALVDLQLLLHNNTLEYSTEYTFCFVIISLESLSFSSVSDFVYFSKYNQALLPPTPTREGYTFTRWYLDEDCTIPYNGEEITQDMTFYAGWIINRYTVTFNSNLGSSAPTQTVEYNTNLTLTTPTREGYDFLGWYNGNTLFTNETLVKSNLTLTAKWKIKTYTVTFMVDNKVYKTIEVEHGTSLAIAMQKAKLTYFAAFNSSGERIGTADSITKNTSVIVGELTTEEKIYTFLANNSWVLWLGGVCSAMFFVTIITLIVKKVRG